MAVAGGMLLVVGVALCVAGLRAGHLQLHSLQSSAWKMALAVVAGVVLAGAGSLLLRRAVQRQLRLPTRERVVPFLVALSVYGGAYAIGWQGISPRGDEPHYMLEAYSLAIDRDRNLAADYVDPVRVAPMFGAFAPGSHAYNYTGDRDVAISMHSVGVPALLVPAAAVSSDVRLMRVEMILIAAAAAYLLLSILRRISGGSSPLVWATWAAFAFSLPLVAYSSQIYPEIPGVFLLLLATRLLLEPGLSVRGTVVAATAGALMPWFHVRFTYLSIVLAAALLVRSQRGARKVEDIRTRTRRALPALGPFFASGALMALANQHWYGSPWLNAQFRLYEQPPKLDLEWAYSHSLGGIFQPVYGWLPFAPVHVMALVGTVYFCWRGRRWALVGGALGLIYLLLVASAKGIEVGFAFPARLQLVLIPVGAIPALMLMRESKGFAVVAIPLGVLTWVIAIVGVLHVDLLTPPNAFNVPTLPVVDKLARLWPGVAPSRGHASYNDWPQLVAWIAAIVLGGLLPTLWPRALRAARS